ncbi:MAG TPA: hypothetical protein VKT30_18155 [Caulobacteraceae bacterium]|nr:hypothetical protein [Caulobacteraceae bacterium]
MNVELAEERILVLPDPTTMEAAEQRAWAKRMDAFGALARMSGFLSKPKDEEFELTYKERRLQPFWRLSAHATYAYERRKTYAVKVASEVQSVEIAGETKAISRGEFTLSGLETCREETSKEFLYDGLAQGAPNAELAAYLKYDPRVVTEAELEAMAKSGLIVVPPQAKASMIVREVVAAMLSKIDADRVTEETVRLDCVDLYYRPIYAFRYRRAGKEAVLELDPLTGAIRPGGATFETYLGKILEPRFLFDVTVETANIFFPGATLARVLVNKSLEFGKRR